MGVGIVDVSVVGDMVKVIGSLDVAAVSVLVIDSAAVAPLRMSSRGS